MNKSNEMTQDSIFKETMIQKSMNAELVYKRDMSIESIINCFDSLNKMNDDELQHHIQNYIEEGLF